MAISWETKITVLDSKRKNVSVSLKRIDDTDPENIETKEYSVLDALIDTPERKQQVLNELHRQYAVEKQKIIDDNETIGTLGDDIKTAAENWEAK